MPTMTDDQDPEVQAISAELDERLADVLNGVQEANEVRVGTYESVVELSKSLSEALKGRELLPRRVLLMLDKAASTLENEASHAKEPARVAQMGRDLRMTLGLILRGESHSDRRPGVPRVV